MGETGGKRREGEEHLLLHYFVLNFRSFTNKEVVLDFLTGLKRVVPRLADYSEQTFSAKLAGNFFEKTKTNLS